MPEVKLPGNKSLAGSISSNGGSTIQKASNTMSDIITLISKGEQLVSHIENIVGMFKKNDGAGSSIIQSNTPPPIRSTQEGPRTSAPAISDQNMESYFSSPEGLKKIADAIDKMVPLIGDLKLSEVKQAIMNNISQNNNKKTEVKDEKKG